MGAAFCSAGTRGDCAEARTHEVPRFRALPEEVKPLLLLWISTDDAHSTRLLLELFDELSMLSSSLWCSLGGDQRKKIGSSLVRHRTTLYRAGCPADRRDRLARASRSMSAKAVSLRDAACPWHSGSRSVAGSVVVGSVTWRAGRLRSRPPPTR